MSPGSFFEDVGKNILSALEQVVAEEETAQRVLHSPTHLDQVLQNVLAREFVRFDVNHSNSDKQIPISQHHTNLVRPVDTYVRFLKLKAIAFLNN